MIYPVADPEMTVYVDADLQDLIPGFLGNRHRDAERLLAAARSNDFESARIIGHGMKGSGGGYGFPRITELGDKVEVNTRTEVEEALKNLKSAIKTDNIADIKRFTEVLTQASHKLAASMYQQTSAAGCQQPGCGTENAQGQYSPGSEDDVVDAEYREVA